MSEIAGGVSSEVEKPQAWKCPKCQLEQVSLISRGCTSSSCGAGSVAPYRQAPSPPSTSPLSAKAKEAMADTEVPTAPDVANEPMPGAALPGAIEFQRPEVGRLATRGSNLSDTAETVVYRLIEYRGPAKWVEDTVMRSLHGSQRFSDDKSITATDVQIMPGTVESKLLDMARGEPLKWLGKNTESSRAKPPHAAEPTADIAVQLWVKAGSEYELVGPRIINTLIAALSFFASEAQPAGGESSMDAVQCMDLATALGKGHLG